MIRIIGGRRYNTNTAHTVGEWDNGCFRSDFYFCAGELFRTKKGDYFLHGQGGAMSCYGEPTSDNMMGPGECITPMTHAEALSWAEGHLPADVVEAEFGDHIVDA